MDTLNENIQNEDTRDGHVSNDRIQTENDNSERNDSTNDDNSTEDTQELSPIAQFMAENNLESEADLVKKLRNQDKKITQQGQQLAQFKQVKDNLSSLQDDPDTSDAAMKLGEAMKPVTELQDKVAAKAKDEADYQKLMQEKNVPPALAKIVKAEGKYSNLKWEIILEKEKAKYDILIGKQEEENALRAGTGGYLTGNKMGSKPRTDQEKMEKRLSGNLPPRFR